MSTVVTWVRTRRTLIAVVVSIAAGLTATVAASAAEWSKALVASPASHAFGDVPVGSTSPMRMSTVTETAASSTVINGVLESCASFSRDVFLVYSIDGTVQDRSTATFPAALYRFVDPQSGTVEQQHLEVEMYFTPGVHGTQACTVVVDRASGTDVNISLSGNGLAPALAVAPASLPFGDLRIGTSSSEQSFTVRNDGNQNLSVGSLSLNGNSEDWEITFDTSSAIAPGSSRMGTVVFSPAAAGVQDATLTITSNDPVDADETVALTGRGRSGPIAFDSVAGSGDGALGEGEQTVGGLTQLLVTFDGAMTDPPGSSATGDVTNPSSYRLFAAGPNGLLETVACGAASGDDVELPVGSVEYFGASFLAAVSFPGTAALRIGSYRLHVCASIEDAAGLPIVAASRTFGVLGDDRLVNPNLDDGLAGWVVSEPVAGSLSWDVADAGGAPSSGSARVSTSDGDGLTWGLAQCVALGIGSSYLGRLRTNVLSPSASGPAVAMAIEHFTALGCAGASLGTVLSPALTGDTGGLWATTTREGNVPAGARSALVTVWVQGGAVASFTAAIDDLFYGSDRGLLADGFETGDLSRWTAPP